MNIVCPRCKTSNSRWEKRCKACWLVFDVALRASVAMPADSVPIDSTPQTQPAPPAETPSGSAQARPTPEEAHQRTLAQLLGVEIVHVRALADAGIHSLEHVAESLPEQIERALGAWAHINPAALIAQARLLLHDPAMGETQPPKRPTAKPEPAEWWKMT